MFVPFSRIYYAELLALPAILRLAIPASEAAGRPAVHLPMSFSLIRAASAMQSKARALQTSA
jgi:hypothetical protein